MAARISQEEIEDSVFVTDDGPVRIGDMTREQLLDVIASIQNEVAVHRERYVQAGKRAMWPEPSGRDDLRRAVAERWGL